MSLNKFYYLSCKEDMVLAITYFGEYYTIMYFDNFTNLEAIRTPYKELADEITINNICEYIILVMNGKLANFEYRFNNVWYDCETIKILKKIRI